MVAGGDLSATYFFVRIRIQIYRPNQSTLMATGRSIFFRVVAEVIRVVDAPTSLFLLLGSFLNAVILHSDL